MNVCKFPVVVFCLIAALARADVLPIDDFIKHGDYLDLKISPDGEHLAARIRQQATVGLYFVRIGDGKVVGGVTPGSDNEVHSVTWVNNERVVYQFAEKRYDLDQPMPTGELFAVNLDSTGSELIYGYRASDKKTDTRIANKKNSNASHEILSILEHDKKKILIIEYPWEKIGLYWYDNRSKPPIISELDVYSGRKKKIETIPYHGAEAIAGKNGQVNFISWLDKEGGFHAAFRESRGKKWQELTTLFNVETTPRPVAVNASLSRAYLLGVTGEERLNTLFEVDLSTGEMTQLFKGLQSDLTGWITDTHTQRPVVGISYPNTFQYHYLKTDSRLAKVHKMLAKAFKGQEVSFTSATPNGDKIVVRVSGDVNPGEYYLYSMETKNADFLWANKSWIDPRQMQPVRPVEVTARDGLRLNGFLTLPGRGAEDTADKKPPLVVLVHGGPHGVRDYWGYDSEAQLLANRGYAVMQINYRGSGGYGEVFEEAGYREWGGKMIDDMIDATQWVVGEGYADAGRICIYGSSYGGYAALMAAVRAPRLYQCTIGYVGIYDLEYMYTKSDIPDFWGGEAYLEQVIGRDERQLAEFSPVNHIEKIEAAVMLIHGRNDRRVPVAHAKAMRRKLEKADKEVTWLLYGRSGHGVWDLDSRRELYSGLLDFLEENIGGDR